MAELSDADKQVLTAYTRLARRIWEDEDYKQRALGDPRAALAENGWDVGPDTDVQLEVRSPDAMPAEPADPGELAGEWRQQVEAGELRVLVTDAPPTDESAELSDEALEDVAGGICGGLDRPCACVMCGCGP